MAMGWNRYYRATNHRPPRETVLRAMRHMPPGLAVDLGCGGGRDARPLLKAGWRVIAIDREADAMRHLRAAFPPEARRRLHPRRTSFERADWPMVDLVHSGFALPLCPPAAFPALWRRIRARLRPGGRFAGQFFGPRDGLAGQAGVTITDAATLRRLLRGLTIEMFVEEETDTITPRGRPKHWHIFHVVARRPGHGR